jgi:hypothetical protein
MLSRRIVLVPELSLCLATLDMGDHLSSLAIINLPTLSTFVQKLMKGNGRIKRNLLVGALRVLCGDSE